MSLSQFVQISPKAKRIYLQRFLLSKFSHFRETTEMRDLCCLFENQLWLERKCLSDTDFSKKFGRDLESLSIILQEINFRTETSSKAIDRFSRKLQENLSSLCLPKRNYKEAFKLCNGLYSLKDSRTQGKLKKTIPPKSRMGIGYRDKGSARDLAFDGSPTWQEVAAHRGPIYHKGVKDENLPNCDTVEQLKETIIGKFFKGGESSRPSRIAQILTKEALRSHTEEEK